MQSAELAQIVFLTLCRMKVLIKIRYKCSSWSQVYLATRETSGSCERVPSLARGNRRRPSPPRGLLNVLVFLNAINNLPLAEQIVSSPRRTKVVGQVRVIRSMQYVDSYNKRACSIEKSCCSSCMVIALAVVGHKPHASQKLFLARGGSR